MPAQRKPRLLWIAVKLFDKSVDKATWLETANDLAQNFEVHFLTGWRDRPAEISVGGRPIRYFPQFGRGIVRKVSRHLFMANAIKREIAEVKPQVVLLNCTDGLGMLSSVYGSCLKHGCKPVLDIRTLPTTDDNSAEFDRFGRILAFAARNFVGVTYITQEMRRYCIERYNLPEHRSVIWTSGVNAEAFLPAAIVLGDGTFRLLYHGGIISVSRGLDRLIQAMDRVRDLDVHLTLISSLRETEAIGWIDRLNLRDRVTLLDTIPHTEIPAAIQRHHAGILPFPSCDVWNTSSPIKLFEYLACGKPVVVTDIPAHSNVLDGKPFAFFSADAKPESLAIAIRSAYAARGQFHHLGQLARQQVLEQHTWARQAEQLGNFLRDVIR